MKIAILSCFYPFRGGISQFNAELLGCLSKTGEVRAFNFTRQYPDFLFPGKTQYVSADDEAVAVDSTAVLDSACPHTYFKTAREILKWNPDIVIMRYWMSYFAPSLGVVARILKRHGKKVIAITDNVIPHEEHFFDKPLTRFFLSGISGAVTLCDAVGDDLKSLRPDIPSTMIPHPLYSHFGEKLPRRQALEALGLDPDKKTLLFFGLVRKYKGLDILLKAFSLLGKDYQMIVAGEPYGSFDEYEEIIAGIPGKERISLNLKYIKDSQVTRYFSGADVCVLPYRSATQSGVSAVSFHFEVPMIVTAVGGLKETIADTGCGLLVEKCEPEAVRDKIVEYFADKGTSIECIGNIRQQKEKLSWSNFAKKLVEFSETL